MAYADLHRASLTDPNAFWMEQAQAIDWVTPPSKALFDEKRAALRMVQRRAVQHLLERG